MNPRVLLLGSSAKLSMICLGLIDNEEALALARRIADGMGRTVSVSDANGEIIETVRAAPKN